MVGDIIFKICYAVGIQLNIKLDMMVEQNEYARDWLEAMVRGRAMWVKVWI